MKVTQEKLPDSQIGLEIEISPEMSKQAYEKTLQEFTRTINIPGFRKGKVPRPILIQQIGSTRIKATVVENLIDTSLKQAIKQENIDVIGNFQLKSSFEDLVQQFEPGSALVFSASVDVPPETHLKQYQGLTVQAEAVEFNPDKVNQVLESYRLRSATLVPVEGRPAQEKDVAVIDFASRLVPESPDAEAKEVPGGSAQDFEVELVEGKFIPGFIEGIWGLHPGESKEIALQFPEGYAQPELAGKPAVFSITLKELKEKELPELDDDFAQDISEFETLAELEASLTSKYQEEAKQQTRSNQETALLNALVEQLEVEVPETLIRREVDSMVTQAAMYLARQGFDVKQGLTQEMVAEMREQTRPEAIARLRRTLALGRIAELESIKVDPATVRSKVTELMQSYADQEIDEQRLREVVEEDLLKEEIFDWLLARNTVELVPVGTLSPVNEADEADESLDNPVGQVAESASEITVESLSSGVDASESVSTTSTLSAPLAQEPPVVEALEVAAPDAVLMGDESADLEGEES
jgi:trigger factor